MSEFLLRSWKEEVLFACNDYRVTADTLADAVMLIQRLQEKSDEEEKDIKHEQIRALEWFEPDEVTPLDPEEISEVVSGVTLIDAEGHRLRDMVGVPIGCEPLTGIAEAQSRLEAEKGE